MTSDSDEAFEIALEEAGSKGRYVLTFDDLPGEEAEMTFSRVSPTMFIIDHTAAPDSMRGRGAGKALVTHAVSDARASGSKIIPLCPFAKALFDKTPDWADVLAKRS